MNPRRGGGYVRVTDPQNLTWVGSVWPPSLVLSSTLAGDSPRVYDIPLTMAQSLNNPHANLPNRPDEIKEALIIRQKARADIDMLIDRIFGLCGTQPPPHTPQNPPHTRSSSSFVHVHLESSCKQCGGKYAIMSLEQYNNMMGQIAFKCDHGQPVWLMTVV